MAQGHKCVSVNVIGCRFDLHSIFLDLLFIFSFLQSGAEAKRGVVPPLNTQCLQKSAENGERSVLTLDSLCLCIHCEADLIFYCKISRYRLYIVC